MKKRLLVSLVIGLVIAGLVELFFINFFETQDGMGVSQGMIALAIAGVIFLLGWGYWLFVTFFIWRDPK